MPTVKRDRLQEYLIKGGHLAGRAVAMAPEQRLARRLSDQAPHGIGSGRRVAILTPRDWSSHVQWEAMIAQGLRLRGADVTFLTCGGGLSICDRANTWEGPPSPCGSCTRYVADSLDAHGFPQIPLRHGWESLPDDGWPELDECPLAELTEIEAEGLPLGRLLRIPVAWFLMRARLEDDPLAASTYRDFLRSARRMVRGLRAALDAANPDVVVLLNGLFSFDAIALALCHERSIDVVTYERGFIKDTLIFRRGEPAALTPLHDLWERRRDVPLTLEESNRLDQYLEDRRFGRRTIDRFWQNAEFGGPTEQGTGKLVVLFPNLTWDSAVIGQTVAFDSIQEWLVAAVRYFADRPEHRLVIRFHPAEVKLPGKQTREPLGVALDEAFDELPANVSIIAAEDNTSSYPLMQACDLGLVFTSTTGLELALAGKPVIVAGRTHYRDKGFTLDATDPQHFADLLDGALDDPASVSPDPVMARRYANLFFFEAPIEAPGVEEHVPGLARITIHDLSRIAPGANAAMDRICDGILVGGDFLPER